MQLSKIADLFIGSQYALLVGLAIAVWMVFRSGDSKSQFRSREADRSDLKRFRQGEDLANAKIVKPKPSAPKPPPLSLPGIRLHGEPHEVLGVREDASEAEIMKAYKDAIKQYHPDRIQGQAKEQIQFYQEAAAQLNQAKETMIQRARKRT